MKERLSIRVLDVVNLAVMYKNEMEGISILSHNYLINYIIEWSNLAVKSVVASEVSDKIHSK